MRVRARAWVSPHGPSPSPSPSPSASPDQVEAVVLAAAGGALLLGWGRDLRGVLRGTLVPAREGHMYWRVLYAWVLLGIPNPSPNPSPNPNPNPNPNPSPNLHPNPDQVLLGIPIGAHRKAVGQVTWKIFAICNAYGVRPRVRLRVRGLGLGLGLGLDVEDLRHLQRARALLLLALPLPLPLPLTLALTRALTRALTLSPPRRCSW